MHYYFDVLKRYWDFNGRTARKEFWMFTVISVSISIILMILDLVIGAQIVLYQPAAFGGDAATGIAPITPTPIEIGMLQNIYALAVFLPSLGVAVRRLHDTGRSGWWWLMNFICCVGWIVLLVFYVTRGTEGDNKYGPDPLSTN